MNLATAKSAGRAKEVGLRKVIGASKKDLIMQFIGEAIFLSFLSVCFHFSVEILLPYFNNLTELNLRIPITRQCFPGFSYGCSGSWNYIGQLPGNISFSIKTCCCIERKNWQKGRNIQLRKMLVFSVQLISLLIIATLIIKQQMNFLSDKKLGFNKEQVVFFNLDNEEIIKIVRHLKTSLPGTPMF